MTTKPTIPEQFGRYRVLKELGGGGMGTVFLAEDTQLGRKVALKVPHFPPGHDGTSVERFYREARIAARIEHPNLCQVFDVGQINGVHYLTMPYVEGRPLSKILRAGEPWTPQMAAGMMRKVALALAFLHEQGVMHRDLKPSNILVQVNGEPVLIDFGLARTFDAEHSHLTEAGSQLGTPAYMSPEQVIGDPKAIGSATDIYSLGVILFEILTGQTPFHGRNHEIYGQILHAQLPSPAEIRKGLDEQICGLCLKAMSRKPGERFASMTAFAQALDDYIRQGSGGGAGGMPVLAGSGSGGMPALPSAPSTPHPAVHPSSTPATPAALTPAPADATTTLVTCGKCGRAVKLTVTIQARRLRCSWCQAPLTPAASATPAPPPPPPRPPAAVPQPVGFSSSGSIPPPLPVVPSVIPLSGSMTAPAGAAPRPLPVATVRPTDLDTPSLASQHTTAEGGSATRIILIVSLSVVALAAIVVLLIVLLNRDDDKKDDPPSRPRTSQPAPRVVLHSPAEIRLVANQTTRIRIPFTLENTTNPVSLTFEGLPAGINASNPLIPTGACEAIVDLDVGPTVPPTVADIMVYAEVDGARDMRQVRLTVATATLAPQQTNSISMRLVLIRPGKFKMGSPATEVKHETEELLHEVAITRPFYVGVYEVTQEQFRRVMNRNPSRFKDEPSAANHPVESVSWNDANEFCRLLSELPEEKRASRLYRLPTEAEWEYACRGGRESEPTNLGPALGHDHANIESRFPYGGAREVSPSRGRTLLVGSFPSRGNGFGLFDMHGNVREWCADWYDRDSYSVSPAVDPPGPQPERKDSRVVRGGSWKEPGERCRSAYRGSAGPDLQIDDIGFRVVMIQGAPQP